MTARPPAEQRISNRARLLAAEAERESSKAERHRRAAAEANDDLRRLHADACERFDRNFPLDPLLIDVLESVVIKPGDRWIWLGVRNNKDLAVIRRARGHELSVVRYLAIALGVIDENENGALYPAAGDTEDINPFHRVLRGRPTTPRYGNHERFNGRRAS